MSEFVIGACSSAMATTIIYPIHYIKNIAQISIHNTGKYSITEIAKSNFKKGGAKIFYNGMLSTQITYPIYWGVFFHFKDTNIFLASVVASLVANPLFVLATLRNTNGQSYKHNISQLNKNIGWPWLFRGYLYTCLNNSKLLLQFPLYDYFRKDHNEIVSGILSKAISTYIFYPTDYFRTLRRNSIANKFVLKKMYAGSFIYMLSSSPNFALMMYFREKFKILRQE
jgi:hypothetical protein